MLANKQEGNMEKTVGELHAMLLVMCYQDERICRTTRTSWLCAIKMKGYVLKMKGYVEQLERLGYVLPQDLTVGLILNGLTSDFARFVRNYNMHNMEKTVGELHVMLIGYENGLPKKAN
ncbi:hypothetical protein Tco_0310755 [Tanacetum coccineum]